MAYFNHTCLTSNRKEGARFRNSLSPSNSVVAAAIGRPQRPSRLAKFTFFEMGASPGQDFGTCMIPFRKVEALPPYSERQTDFD